MGKNNLKNPHRSGNPIYKRVGGVSKKKGPNTTKMVKTNLKKISIKNKDAVKALDKKIGIFHEALQKDQTKEIKTDSKRLQEKLPPPVNVDEAIENFANL